MLCSDVIVPCACLRWSVLLKLGTCGATPKMAKANADEIWDDLGNGFCVSVDGPSSGPEQCTHTAASAAGHATPPTAMTLYGCIVQLQGHS